MYHPSFFLPVRSRIQGPFRLPCVRGTFPGAGYSGEKKPDASMASYICFGTDVHDKGHTPLIFIRRTAVTAQRSSGSKTGTVCGEEMQMERWLDIIITGAPSPGFEQVMDKLMANYDGAQVYETGAPQEGVNPQVTAWAFRHRYPLVLGMPEDADAVLCRFRCAQNRAVVVFSDGSAVHRERNAAAKLLALLSGAQYREITV